ncbi:MAG: hypothetical protein QXU98_07255 [Candidatus Parvarchaeota archaeon]
MIFPSDSEIREYAAYEVRTRKIILEEFKQEYGREPSELEIPELLKAAIIPIGLLPKSGRSQDLMNQNKSEEKSAPAEQPKNQPAQFQKSEVLRLLNEFPQNLERKSQSRIQIIKEIPRSEWNEVKKGFEKEGWKYNWKEKSFISEEMKA